MKPEHQGPSPGQQENQPEEVGYFSLVGFWNPELQNSPIEAALLGVKSAEVPKLYTLPSPKTEGEPRQTLEYGKHQKPDPRFGVSVSVIWQELSLSSGNETFPLFAPPPPAAASDREMLFSVATGHPIESWEAVNPVMRTGITDRRTSGKRLCGFEAADSGLNGIGLTAIAIEVIP